MTDFFSTMINRHLGTAEVIAPRPRARFEPESSIAAADIAANNFATEQNQAHQKEQDRHAAEKSAELSFKGYGKESRFNAPITQGHLSTVFPLREQGKTAAPSVETRQKLKAQDGSPGTPPVEKHQSPIGGMHYEAPSERTLESGLDNRIETLLQQLRGQPAPQSLTTRADSPNRGSLSQPPEVGREEIAKSSRQQARGLPQEGKRSAVAKIPELTISPIERNSRQAGLLEPPPWLSEMQAEFNRRWQEMNSRIETEPVINVTIGRVEVRAVQAESPKQSKRKNKPIGVMSLDEYLSQRGHGGRT